MIEVIVAGIAGQTAATTIETEAAIETAPANVIEIKTGIGIRVGIEREI